MKLRLKNVIKQALANDCLPQALVAMREDDVLENVVMKIKSGYSTWLQTHPSAPEIALAGLNQPQTYQPPTPSVSIL